MDTSLEPLFQHSAPDMFTATAQTLGPWAADTQHGGAPAALLMRQIERVTSPTPMAVTRFTMEILGPVPVGELRVSTTVVRPGRRIQLVAAELSHRGNVVATASAWRIATGVDSGVPPGVPAMDVGPPDPTRFDDGPVAADGASFATSAVQMHVVAGSFTEPGPGAAWFRLVHPVVPGEEPSPSQRAAAVADFGNGLAAVARFADFFFINTDLTVSLGRVPAGEWVLLESATVTGATGHGISTSRLGDMDGQFGHATQSLMIAPRP